MLLNNLFDQQAAFFNEIICDQRFGGETFQKPFRQQAAAATDFEDAVKSGGMNAPERFQQFFRHSALHFRMLIVRKHALEKAVPHP